MLSNLRLWRDASPPFSWNGVYVSRARARFTYSVPVPVHVPVLILKLVTNITFPGLQTGTRTGTGTEHVNLAPARDT